MGSLYNGQVEGSQTEEGPDPFDDAVVAVEGQVGHCVEGAAVDARVMGQGWVHELVEPAGPGVASA